MVKKRIYDPKPHVFNWPTDSIIVPLDHPDPLNLTFLGLTPENIASENELKYIENIRSRFGVGIPHIGRYGYGISMFSAGQPERYIITPNLSVIHQYTKRPYKGYTVVGRMEYMLNSSPESETDVFYLNAHKNNRHSVKINVKLNGRSIVDEELNRRVEEVFSQNRFLRALGLYVEPMDILKGVYERALFYRYRNPVSIDHFVNNQWDFLDKIKRYVLSFIP